MGLIPAKSKDVNYYIRRVKTEMAHTFLTVHDEIDFVADRSILFALCKRMSQLLDISKYYAKYNVPYIRYLFDVEYDNWGAWTASESIKVYSSPLTREENEAIKEYKASIKFSENNAEPEEEEVVEETEISIKLADLLWTSEELISALEKLPQGNTTLKVIKSKEGSKPLKFYKKLKLEPLKELLRVCLKP
jgi:hypothetical protein